MSSEEGTEKYGSKMPVRFDGLRSFGFAPPPSRAFDTSVSAVSQNNEIIHLKNHRRIVNANVSGFAVNVDEFGVDKIASSDSALCTATKFA